MRTSFLAPPPASPSEVPLAPLGFLPIDKGDSQPAPAPPASIQETDLAAAAAWPGPPAASSSLVSIKVEPEKLTALLGTSGPAMQQMPPLFIQETNQETDLILYQPSASPAASQREPRAGRGVSSRGSFNLGSPKILADPRGSWRGPRRDAVDGAVSWKGDSVRPLRGTFSMRGELMHAFVSYRVSTEGTDLTFRQSSEKRHPALLHARPLLAPAAHRAPLRPHALMALTAAQAPMATGSPRASPRASGRSLRTSRPRGCTFRAMGTPPTLVVKPTESSVVSPTALPRTSYRRPKS
ncbi:hypothetical protein T484DRAFT_3099689 [Baffinella frigidus]|nr:hypothetical protein T484DRAFT_3099689 [Cryptophyta sp. CCMP2293]